MKVYNFYYGKELVASKSILDKRTSHHYIGVGTIGLGTWLYKVPIDDRHVNNYGKDLGRVSIAPLMHRYDCEKQMQDKYKNNVFILSSGKKDNRIIICIEEIVDDVVTVDYGLFGELITLGNGSTRTLRGNKIKVPMIMVLGKALIKITRKYDEVIKTFSISISADGFIEITQE